MLNIYYKYTTNGPGKVVNNLKKGLELAGIKFQENISHPSQGEKGLFLQDDDRFGSYDERNLIIGPNICTLPIDNAFVMRKRYEKIIVPSEWVKNLYIRWIPEEKIAVWPVGIDTELFSDKKNYEKSIDCLIYFKRRSTDQLRSIITMLTELNQSYCVMEYGHYTEPEFIKNIERCRYGIVLDKPESQGIAIQEMMSCNLPLFVMDYTKWDDRGQDLSCDATSVPYWNFMCGMKIIETEDTESNFKKFLSYKEQCSPRKFLKYNLNLEKQAIELEKLFHEDSIYF